MLFFLLSAFFMVSAGEEITAFVEDNVLLPCDCSTEEFSWQKDEEIVVIENHKGNLSVNDNYNDKIKTYFHGGSRNCSILLTNITLDFQGQYRCIVYAKKYTYFNVDLKVCGSDVCQYTQKDVPGGGTVYHCNVRRRCRQTEIKWILDEETHKDSPTITISNTSNLDAKNGLYYFYSTLKTEHKFASEPQCNVTCAKNERVVGPSQSPTTTSKYNDPDPFLKTLCKVVPVVLIIGFLLIWCRRGTSHRVPGERDVENSDFSEATANSDKLQNENVLSSYPEEVINQ